MTSPKRAFITGITGQDGSYLMDLLLDKGYEVHGLVRRSSTFNRERIDHVFEHVQKGAIFADRVTLHYGDLSDASNLARLLEKINPDEIYNLGAQSHVRISFDIPEYTADIDALGTLRLLEAIRDTRILTKFYQASSSEMFGKIQDEIQNESTPFYPRSPYASAKVFGYWTTVNYREAYNLHASNGILFNHESPRRGENFVTRKIAMAVVAIATGKQDKVYLGNLSAKRDWGYAPEYVECMWRMLQQDAPDDYVIATGETHSVEEFVIEAFRNVGIDDWKKFVEIDQAHFRPTEVDLLLGDSTKAKKVLKWEPKVTFKELVKIMVEAECEKIGFTPST